MRAERYRDVKRAKEIKDIGRRIEKRIERRRHKIPSGALEAVIVGLKPVFERNGVFGVDQDAFWIVFEKRAGMSLREACFQYYLAGKDHMALANIVLKSLPAIKTALGMGSLTDAEYEFNYLQPAASELFNYYPPKYRERYQKNHKK